MERSAPVRPGQDPPASARKLGMVAGEASSDLLASGVLQTLTGRAGRAFRAAGIGGPRMQAAGFDAWWPSERLAVHGYAEALRALPGLFWIRERLIHRLVRWPVHTFIGIDAPDFNLGLELRLRRAGVRTLHFVSPSIWAWRPERITKIRAAVDHMLLVFPFEEAIYREAGIPATYVGHPLADSIALQPDRQSARAALGLAGVGAPLIAVLPGSRRGEVARLAPLFAEVVRLLLRSEPQARFLVPAAGPERMAELRPVFDRMPAVTLLDGQSHRALEAADLALLASGTATLEAALFKLPMVIAYRIPDSDYRRMKDRTLLPYYGLPNILSGRFVVPEFIQDEARPEPIARALLEQWRDEAGRAALVERFDAMHLELRRGCAQRVAEVIGE